MPSLLFDIECNNKYVNEVSIIWCFSFCLDLGEEITYDFRDPQTEVKVKDLFNRVDTIIGHNIIAYDLPVLAKLVFKCPVKELFKRYKTIDTLVLSRALDPDRDMKKHGLGDWAKRLGGEQKVKQSTWAEWDDNYLVRCPSDVRINKKVLSVLQQEIEQEVTRNG